MEMSKSPWEKGALFICEKCGRRVGSDDYAENTKKEFKSRLKDDGFGKSIRVMTSSCLSLCPKNQQVVAWCPANGPMQMMVYNPDKETEDIYKWLKKR
ncbi:MAG: (2Fe-2S) ferredoxin domain-containing protein [Bdellovibrionaceae bacterium]|nr:(2Fe-2S) ferredoxin domain-containing protein [Pseudobdellovibrionaceae bacterium]MBX3032797.1 (2Fe-2S) ferredoxin domain-containing protein [Pseudobdellovibrionaceae bacterium]